VKNRKMEKRKMGEDRGRRGEGEGREGEGGGGERAVGFTFFGTLIFRSKLIITTE
jgi:hypothetical protein